MSLDITFQKSFTIEDIKNKTSITVEFKNNNYWMCKNESVILIRFHPQHNNLIIGLTRHGMNDLSEIMDELVLTFQTKFITDEEDEELFRDNNIDIDKMFDDVTKSYGYNIKNNIISK